MFASTSGCFYLHTRQVKISLMINQCKWEILQLIGTKEASFTGYQDVNVIYLFEETRVWETKEDYVNFSILIFNKEGCINYFYEEKPRFVFFWVEFQILVPQIFSPLFQKEVIFQGNSKQEMYARPKTDFLLPSYSICILNFCLFEAFPILSFRKLSY